MKSLQEMWTMTDAGRHTDPFLYTNVFDTLEKSTPTIFFLLFWPPWGSFLEKRASLMSLHIELYCFEEKTPWFPCFCFLYFLRHFIETAISSFSGRETERERSWKRRGAYKLLLCAHKRGGRSHNFDLWVSGNSIVYEHSVVRVGRFSKFHDTRLGGSSLLEIELEHKVLKCRRS